MNFIDKSQILLTGNRFKIVHCAEAEASLFEALSHVNQKKRGALTRAIEQQFERLANGARLSKENFPSEGELPNNKKFYALKKIPIRAYCWHSKICRNTIFISHYVYKDKKKLNPSDTDKVGNNWNKKEIRDESN